MAEKTNIQWADATVNFWHGCKKVSAGCKFCYMFRDKEMHKQDPTVVVKTSAAYLRGIFRKLKDTPSTIFTCSWSDFFIDVADPWRDEAWQIIAEHPQHLFLILTKRIERVHACLPAQIPSNIMLGISAEDHGSFWQRWPVLEELARCYDLKTFVSFEPLLGPISNLEQAFRPFDLKDDPDEPKMTRPPDWVIVGGESGNERGPWLYRPCKLWWIESIVSAAMTYQVPVLVKQLGTYLSNHLNLKNRHGGDMEEFPEQLRLLEFPPFKPFKYGEM